MVDQKAEQAEKKIVLSRQLRRELSRRLMRQLSRQLRRRLSKLRMRLS